MPAPQINVAIQQKMGEIRDILVAMEEVLAALPASVYSAVPFAFSPSSAAQPFVAAYSADESGDRKKMLADMARKVSELGAEIAALPPLVEGP